MASATQRSHRLRHDQKLRHSNTSDLSGQQSEIDQTGYNTSQGNNQDIHSQLETTKIMLAAITVAQKGSSNSNNNNNSNSSQQALNTPSGLEGLFRHQNEIWEEQQEEQKQQQKWNLVKSSKIPTLFLPKEEKIQPILYRLNGLEGVANGYTTKCTQNGAIRLLCNSTDVYNKISQELHNNNAELLRIKRSAYLETDHREWDLYLPKIEVALRNSVHTATGVTPFFALFGQHLMLNGAQYALGRKLQSLCERIRVIRQGRQAEADPGEDPACAIMSERVSYI
ncbi:hypothetical protein ACLKA6_012777 [Drosophila palustris]